MNPITIEKAVLEQLVGALEMPCDRWNAVQSKKVAAALTAGRAAIANAEQPQRDACGVCNGARGGVPGNENIINGVVTCDYCHAIAEQVQPSGERGIIADLKRTVKSLQNEEDGGWTPDAHSHLLRLATSINMLAADAPKCEPVAWLYFHSRCEEQLSVQLEEPDIVKSFDADVVWKKPLYTHAEPAHGWKHAGQMPPDDDTMREAANALAPWLSASLDDDNACKEYKDAVSAWFNAAMPAAPSTGERNE